jgi:hypothetical protein
LQSTLVFRQGNHTSPNPLIKYYYDYFICLLNYILKILCVDLAAVADVSSVHIDIESLQNRLLKVCYVPATSAGLSRLLFVVAINSNKGVFTLANFARDFALSLHVLLNKNYLFSLLNVQASAKSRAKSRQCKRTLMKQTRQVVRALKQSILLRCP